MEFESPSGVDQIELAAVEQLVPPDHLLRKTKKYIDFGFIRKKAAVGPVDTHAHCGRWS